MENTDLKASMTSQERNEFLFKTFSNDELYSELMVNQGKLINGDNVVLDFI